MFLGVTDQIPEGSGRDHRFGEGSTAGAAEWRL
jgi:hypothetical protein